MTVAVNAPSHRNTQLYHFTVVQDKSLLRRMSDIIRNKMLNSGIPSHAARASKEGYCPLYHAPTVIFISGDLDASFHVHTACGIAAGNIVSMATIMGIGSCVLASSLFMFKGEEGDEIKKLLKIPGKYKTVCSIALGYPNGPAPEIPERKTGLVAYV